MSRPILFGLMAADPRGVVGLDNGLPWSFVDETQHFHETLAGQTAIMGRVTFEQTDKDLLATCHNVILSRTLTKKAKSKQKVPYLAIVDTVADVLKHPYLILSRTNYLIGGADVMNQFLQKNLVDGFILSLMAKNYEGETRIDMDCLNRWDRKTIKSSDAYVVYKMLNPESPYYGILKS